jgi:hypothetical protein
MARGINNYNQLELARCLRRIPDWQKGYIAGIVDGEGSMGLYRYGGNGHGDGWAPHINIEMKSKTTIDYLNGLIGLGFVDQPRIKKPLLRCQTYRLHIGSSVEVFLFLDCFGPYLCTKQKQAQLLKQYCEAKMAKIATSALCNHINAEISKLNRVGP